MEDPLNCSALLLIITLFGSLTIAYSSSPVSLYNYTQLLYKTCDATTNPSAGVFVNSLINRSFKHGFNVSIERHGSQKFYGVVECRGDLSRKECETCVEHVLSEMKDSCRDSSGSWIQLEGCYLRYEKRPFFWEEHDFFEVGHQCGGKLLSMEDFREVLQIVYSAPLLNGFSAATVSNSNTSVYGLASCNVYLNQYDCQTCLRLGLYLLRFNCYNFDDAFYSVQGESQILMDSCFLRLDRYRFYDREEKGSWWNLQFPSRPPHKLNKLALGLSFGAAGALGIGILTLVFCLKLRARRKMMKVHCIVVDGEVPRLSHEVSIPS